MVMLAGVDLAWQSTRNPTAIAFGALDGSFLSLLAVRESLYSHQALLTALQDQPDLQGVAIDGPLIINNEQGQRGCERELTRVYGSRHAGCHASNLTLYPDSDGVQLASALVKQGFMHLAAPEGKWQLECYPHPALIEIFRLPERLPYKKGRVAERRLGQQQLASLLDSLASSAGITLSVPDHLNPYFDPARIATLRGRQLKHNEDVLDAVICLYIAALYQSDHPGRVFGDRHNGYVYVPAGD
ncbi:MAG: DUF429 domain-containing protein [Oleiphilaceae bacterium]|nr:DUF429 domain-containing protein [Oleiphilaceae bacterium]